MASFSREDTHAKIIDIIAEKLSVDKATIADTAQLQDLGADSLDLVEMIMKFEEQFGMTINDEDAEKLHTVDEVVAYVQERRTK